MADRKDLAELIRQNPGAKFVVDNDCWWMLPAGADHELENIIADYGDVIQKGGGYGSGNTYGGDILQALAEIVGVTIESV